MKNISASSVDSDVFESDAAAFTSKPMLWRQRLRLLAAIALIWPTFAVAQTASLTAQVTVNADGYGSSTSVGTSTFPASDPDGGRNNGLVCTGDLMNYRFSYSMTPGPLGETSAPGGQLDIQLTQGVAAMPPITPSNSLPQCQNVLPANYNGAGNAAGEWPNYDPALSAYTYFIAGSQQSHLICAPVNGIVSSTNSFDIFNVRVFAVPHDTPLTANLTVRSTGAATSSATSSVTTTVVTRIGRNISKQTNTPTAVPAVGADLVTPGFMLQFPIQETDSYERCRPVSSTLTFTDNAGSISPNAVPYTWGSAPSGFAPTISPANPYTSYFVFRPEEEAYTLLSSVQPGGPGTPIITTLSQTNTVTAALLASTSGYNTFDFYASSSRARREHDFAAYQQIWIPDSDVAAAGCTTFTNRVLDGDQANNGPTLDYLNPAGRADDLLGASSSSVTICRNAATPIKYFNRITALGAPISTDRIDVVIPTTAVVPGETVLMTPYMLNVGTNNGAANNYGTLNNAQVCDLLPPEVTLTNGPWGSPARAFYATDTASPKNFVPTLQVEYAYKDFGTVSPQLANDSTPQSNANRKSGQASCGDTTLNWSATADPANWGGNTPNMVRIKSGATLPLTTPGPILGIEIVGTVQASAQPFDSYFNFMSYRSDGTNGGAWSNTEKAEVVVAAKVAGVRKTTFNPDHLSPLTSSVLAGDRVSFRLRATAAYYWDREGPVGLPIRGLTLVDTLPADMTLLDVSAPYSYNPATRNITINLPDIPISGASGACDGIQFPANGSTGPAECGVYDVWVDAQLLPTAATGTDINTVTLTQSPSTDYLMAPAVALSKVSATTTSQVTVNRVNQFVMGKRLSDPTPINLTDSRANAWYVDVTNMTPAAISTADVIDILPVAGDSAFDIRTGTGPATYTSVALGATLTVTSVNVPAAPTGGAITVYYTTNAASSVKDDPNDPLNVLPPSASSIWLPLCTRTDVDPQPSCTPPTNATALRFVVTNLPALGGSNPNGTTYSIGLSVANANNLPGDRWCNSTFGRVPVAIMPLPVRSVNTCLEVREVPRIGAAKQLVNYSGPDGDGIYTYQIQLKVQNVGDVPLSNVTLEESLSGALASTALTPLVACPATITDLAVGRYCIASMPAVISSKDATLNLNGGFTGSGTNSGILATGSTLAVGGEAVIGFIVKVRPGARTAQLNNNNATAGGTSPNGTTVLDASVNYPTISGPLAINVGTLQVNPDGDTTPDTFPNPGNNTSPTPLPMPRIGVAKSVTVSTAALRDSTGFYTQSFDLRVQNTGNEALVNVQVVDQLDASGGTGTTADPFLGFGSYVAVSCSALAAGQYTLAAAPAVTFVGSSSSATINSAYTGQGTGSTAQLLATGATLEAQGILNLKLQVCFRPTVATGVIFNSATASGIGTVSNTPVSDVSQNGINVDGGSATAANNGDYWPGNNTAPTPTTFNSAPQIASSKTLIGAAFVSSGTYAGTYQATFRVRVANIGSVPLQAVVVQDDLTAAGRFGSYVAGVPAVGQYTIAAAPTIVEKTFGAVALAYASYTGSPSPLTNSYLNTGAMTLGLADYVDFQFSIYFRPSSYNPALVNQVYVTANDSSDNPTADLSNNVASGGSLATQLDPNGDGVGNSTTTGSCSTTLTSLTPTAACENAPTPVPLPNMAVAKTVGTPVYNHTGTYAGTVDIPYSIYVRNTGGERIDGVNLQDDLAATFVGISSANIQVLTTPTAIAAGSLTALPQIAALQCYTRIYNPATGAYTALSSGVNSGFNGTTNTALLMTSTVNIAVDSELRCDYTVRIRPGSLQGPFYNTALAGGIGSGSRVPVADYSNNFIAGGTAPTATSFDPNLNNGANEAGTAACPATTTPGILTAACENAPTPVTLAAGVDIIKSAGTVVNPAFLTYQVPYTLVVQNTSGVVTATNVQVTDGLCAVYNAVGCTGATANSPTLSLSTAPAIAATSGHTCSLSSSSLNSGYTGLGATGSAVNNLLTGQGTTLLVTEACNITFTVQLVYPSIAAVPTTALNNQATVASYLNPASTAGGVGTTQLGGDTSTNSTTPPAIGAVNSDTPSPTPVTLSVALATLSGKVYNEGTGAGIGGQTITLTGIDTYGNTVGLSVTTASAPVAAGTLCAAQTTALAIGDYFFCNVLPSNSSGYTVSQGSQPALTTNGTTTAGNFGGTASNPTPTTSQIAAVVLSGGNAATGYNFGEVGGYAISGNVYNDVNGLNDAGGALVNGGGTNAGSSTLTAYLVRNNVVVASTLVAAGGTYSFANILPNTGYTVVLSNTAGVLNGAAEPAASLPSGWSNVGDQIGTTAGGATNATQGVSPSFDVVNAPITNVNFGIEQPPTAGTFTLNNQPNPGGTTTLPVPAGAFTGVLPASGSGTNATDPGAGGAVTSITITAFPTNVASITINGTTYTSAASFPPGGVTVTTAELAGMTIDPVDGTVTVQISYTATDAAGLTSATGSVNLPLAGISVSGTVWDDANNSALGTFTNIQTGTEAGTNAAGLNAVLVDATGKVVAVTSVTSNGTYSFANVAPGTGYQIVLTTSNPAVGSTIVPATVANLPTGWVATSPLVMTAFNVVDTNVTSKDFGIEQVPIATNVSSGPYLNPNGTVTVQAPTLAGADVEDGAFGAAGSAPNSTFTIASVPDPVTQGKLYYNGTLVTAGLVISNYDPTLLKIDPVDGTPTVVFTYTVTDAAGKTSVPATATTTFTTLSITGTVYDDANGSAQPALNAGTFSAINDAGELPTNAGSQLYAVLTTTTGTVLQAVPVLAGGGYTFTNVTPNLDVVVLITNTSPAVGTTFTTPVLPATWTATSPLSYPTFNTGMVNTTLKDFGIEQPPVANSYTAPTQHNPGAGVPVAVPVGALSGTDAEDGAKGAGSTFTVTVLPTNATLYYDGAPVVAGVPITSFDPTKLTIAPTSTGALTAQFSYTVTDNAGKVSVPATIKMPFDQLLLSGNVFNDLNADQIKQALTESGGLPTVNAVLLNSSGAVVAVAAVDVAGNYSFPVAPNSTYTVLLSTASPAPGTSNPPVTLPTGWVTTGENLNGVLEAPADSQQTVSVVDTNVDGVNFGIRQPADMTSTLVCTPSPASASTTVTCTVTCENIGTGTAQNVFCSAPNASTLNGYVAGTCPQTGLIIPAGGKVACNFTFVYAGPTPVTVTGGTGANNDVHGGTDPTLENNPSSTLVGVPIVTVSGTVYTEANSNTSYTAGTDLPLSEVTVTLTCTSPTYSATTSTDASGNYSFDAPAGASCTITQTQPANTSNAYCASTDGAAGAGCTAGTTTNSVITLTVPTGGSTGNNFAEQGADMTSQVVCVPNPAAPGGSSTCTVTCTNSGPGTALGAFCAGAGGGASCSTSGTVLMSGTLTCSFSVTTPLSGTVAVTSGTGATNDTNGGAVATAGNNPNSTVLGVSGVTVSGRVYREASSPLNTTDNGNLTDPGLGGVTVSLQCTAPTYPATGTLSVQTLADGSYSFANVPAGASCTITETQPAVYTNAYNTMGAGGTSQSGAVAGSSTDSVIKLTVPATDSSGNNFAEQSADMVSAVVCTPNPAPAGTTVTCTVTCTNHGPGTAVAAFCQTTGTLPNGATSTCPVSGNVLNQGALTCKVTFTSTGQPVTITGGTGADNDTIGGTNPSGGNNPSSTTSGVPIVTEVPVFNSLGLLLLALLVAAGGFWGTRRQAPRRGR